MSEVDVSILRARYKNAIPLLGECFVDEYGKLRIIFQR